MKLRCIRNGILFVLLEPMTSSGHFIEKTKWGLEITPFNSKQSRSFSNTIRDRGRWGKVLTIGPECKNVKVGNYICVEPNMWTNSFTYDGIQIRKTDESKVLLISEEKPDIYI